MLPLYEVKMAHHFDHRWNSFYADALLLLVRLAASAGLALRGGRRGPQFGRAAAEPSDPVRGPRTERLWAGRRLGGQQRAWTR